MLLLGLQLKLHECFGPATMDKTCPYFLSEELQSTNQLQIGPAEITDMKIYRTLFSSQNFFCA